ncbi:MAG: type II CAAX prenyl endopeptidase Rce1 family protein [Coriobacteriia bacterium]
MSLADLGFGAPHSWLATFGAALLGLAVMLAYSPVADRLASRLVAAPPSLEAFRVLRRSWVSLTVGILVAWSLGGFLEEFVLRGIVVRGLGGLLGPLLGRTAALVVGVVAAALLAGLVHLYQGRRGALIVAQLSVLFGVLYVASGLNLWAVILCHGMYDTIAFIRFARGQSRYSAVRGDDSGG